MGFLLSYGIAILPGYSSISLNNRILLNGPSYYLVIIIKILIRNIGPPVLIL